MRPAPKVIKVRRASSPALRIERPLEQRMADPVWYVCVEGSEPVGPVSADQIARGIRAGKVPSDASVRHRAEVFWTDVLDVPDIFAALKQVSIESEPPPPPPDSVRLTLREFYVWTDGNDPVGPVSADQIARGIRAGKVPADASVQRKGDFFASGVLDEPDVIEALKLLP